MALVQADHRSSFENNYAVVVLGARKDFKAQAAPAQDDPEFHGDTVSLEQDALVSCAYDTNILREKERHPALDRASPIRANLICDRHDNRFATIAIGSCA